MQDLVGKAVVVSFGCLDRNDLVRVRVCIRKTLRFFAKVRKIDMPFLVHSCPSGAFLLL